ncbi:MAG: metallophosphoesterase [Thermodesulfovibrionales bacterium]|nr:metallophosphoesterase [Thermodesulfovibrionales bacterium]
MILFFIFFFSLYGSMHLYAFLKVRNNLSLSTGPSVLLALFMLIMTFAPLIIRLSERQGLEGFAISMAWIGYLWMALLFLFTFFSIASDTFIFILKRIIPSISSFRPLAFYLSLFLSLSLTIYGYIDALNIRTERIEIKSSKIKRPLRIVQISDVHIGLIVKDERLKRIINKIKEAEPDILVSTGDLVDGQIDRLDGISEHFREINPPYGKYAITGNHEFYAGLKQALSFTEKAGFTVLRGEAVYLPELNLSIAGVDDTAGKVYGLYRDVDEERLLGSLEPESFILFLKHRPLINNSSRGLFDLQLSGHTHKGQIFPFSILTRLYYPRDSGCLSDINGCYLYVSRGSGTWGPPVRVFAPPEVTVIEITKN